MSQSSRFVPRPPVWECIAFDFDGTLADTRSAIVGTAMATLDSLELPRPSTDAFLALIGLPLLDSFLQIGVSADMAPRCVERYRELFSERTVQVELFPFAQACLEALRAEGIPLAIVSSRGRSSLLQLIERLEVGVYFEAVLGAEDAPRSKPAPDPLLRLSSLVRSKLDRMVIIGDTTYDMEMGRAAGAWTCAVTYGNHSRNKLCHAKPDFVIDSLSQLEAALLP